MSKWGSRPAPRASFSAMAHHAKDADFSERLRAAEIGPWYGFVSEATNRPGVFDCVWRCHHRHGSPEEARDCARDYYQNGPKENEA